MNIPSLNLLDLFLLGIFAYLAILTTTFLFNRLVDNQTKAERQAKNGAPLHWLARHLIGREFWELRILSVGQTLASVFVIYQTLHSSELLPYLRNLPWLLELLILIPLAVIIGIVAPRTLIILIKWLRGEPLSRTPSRH